MTLFHVFQLSIDKCYLLFNFSPKRLLEVLCSASRVRPVVSVAIYQERE